MANLSIPKLLPNDSTASCDLIYQLTSHIKSRLQGCPWLEENTIEFVGDRPVNAGEVADIYVGILGNRKVIVKCYRFYPSSDYFPTHTKYRQEASAYHRFRNQNLVPFIGIYSTPQYPACLVFELMEHPNFPEYLRKNKRVGRCELLLEIARAVECLHRAGVAHKNIKTSNVFVDAHDHAHLGGLGVAHLLSGTTVVEIDKSFHGAAPELVDNERCGSTDTGATTASDIYAFAVLAWETFAGGFPFPGEPKDAAVFSMQNGRRPTRPNHPNLSDHLWRTIEACWEADPGKRMSIADVVAVLEKEVAAHKSKSR